MAWIAGVDGCKAGWFRVCLETTNQELQFDIISDVLNLQEQTPSPVIIAIDIPIGLSESNPRACDQQARACIGERRNSVFPAPIRPALEASSQEEASRITESVNGKRVSAQAWGIYSKIKSVDNVLATHKSLRTTLFEVHPEVCFWAWNDKTPMQFAKKKDEGLSERIALVNQWLGDGVFDQARELFPKNKVANDDITDAFAALWTANRIHLEDAETIPDYLENDSTGLAMQIVY